ncbi:hypothetical protein [uncultured Methanobrevibacter sp.]|uniref:hypothetical protein n=2 Tax=uncultured Methanobrevibacter sp. TaxID=253161 RepID=UPI0025F73628|nr:hypothetical protein [uncultured Methanobrevibacter sp.]
MVHRHGKSSASLLFPLLNQGRKHRHGHGHNHLLKSLAVGAAGVVIAKKLIEKKIINHHM